MLGPEGRRRPARVGREQIAPARPGKRNGFARIGFDEYFPILHIQIFRLQALQWTGRLFCAAAAHHAESAGAGGLFAFSIAASSICFFKILAHSFVAQAEAVVPSLPPPTGAKVSL